MPSGDTQKGSNNKMSVTLKSFLLPLEHAEQKPVNAKAMRWPIDRPISHSKFGCIRMSVLHGSHSGLESVQLEICFLKNYFCMVLEVQAVGLKQV